MAHLPHRHVMHYHGKILLANVNYPLLIEEVFTHIYTSLPGSAPHCLWPLCVLGSLCFLCTLLMHPNQSYRHQKKKPLIVRGMHNVSGCHLARWGTLGITWIGGCEK